MIIALKGPAQCGKSTLATMLEKELSSRGFNVKRTAFSDFVREEIYTAWKDRYNYFDIESYFHISPDYEACEKFTSLTQDLVQEQRLMNQPVDIMSCLRMLEQRPAPPAVRAIQQWWGQDFRRAQDPLYWIKKSFLANAEFILESGNNILIEESCRQQNEGHYVQALGGIVLDLKPLPSPTESEGEAMSHSVEQAALSWKGDIEIDMAYVFKCSKEQKAGWIQVNTLECLNRMGLPTYGTIKAHR